MYFILVGERENGEREETEWDHFLDFILFIEKKKNDKNR